MKEKGPPPLTLFHIRRADHTVCKWWDGAFGNVLHGPWASKDKNPSKGVLHECRKFIKED